MSSSALALQSTCLRCQLHAAVRQTGSLRLATKHTPQGCRTFSTRPPQCREAAYSSQRDHAKGGYKWRSVALFDEKHGKKRKPIIVLEDAPKSKGKGKDKARTNDQRHELSVVEGKIGQENTEAALSAEQIEGVVSKRHMPSTQAEVNASIEAMRSEATKTSTVMDTSSFETQLKDLAKSYTIDQLGRYLRRSIRSPSSKVYELETSPWRPGRTPLAHRIPRGARKRGPRTKLEVAEQILRLVWEITVEAEEIEDGELEIALEQWQLTLLFDVTRSGTRLIDSLVTPRTLIQNSEIQAHRPDNVLRITARCQTAEEIARQLKLALLEVRRLEWDLKTLVPSVGTPGMTPIDVFRREDVSYIARLTESVIVSESDTRLTIYCMDKHGTLNARRLLLVLLDQQHLSFVGVANTGIKDAAALSMMPIGNARAGVQRRYHSSELFRTVNALDRRKNDDDDNVALAAGDVDGLATSLAQQLDMVESTRLDGPALGDSASYWHQQAPNDFGIWKAKFCTILHEDAKGAINGGSLDDAARSHTVVQHAIPGIENLLPLFEAPQAPKVSKYDTATKLLPYVKVHLQPASRDLNFDTVPPRLEMLFHFSPSNGRTGSRELLMTGIQAIVDEQCMSVPLPGHATDLQFLRQSKVMAKIDAAEADPKIISFVRHLQKSARQSKGALTAPAELLVKLPSWLVELKGSKYSATSPDVPIKYMFERFEQIQNVELTPRHREEQEQETVVNIQSTLQALPARLSLDYEEVEGGAIYGSSTALSLRLRQEQAVAGSVSEMGKEPPKRESEADQISKQPPSGASFDLAAAALRVAHLLTWANAGSLSRTGLTSET